jgi:hypothetical protein
MLFLLWKENMTQPLIDPLVMFSLAWTVGNVFITLLVYTSIRTMLSSSAIIIKSKIIPTSEELQLNQAALQMEAAYASCTLVSIGFVWITISVLTNLTDQMLPSLFMLLKLLVAVPALLVLKDLITSKCRFGIKRECKDCEVSNRNSSR